jgi:Ni2+-binding GTPase involved in maturation of urease and hydrogenase
VLKPVESGTSRRPLLPTPSSGQKGAFVTSEANTAIRDDITANLLAVEDLEHDFAPVDVTLVESGGDNLTATFSPGLVDAQRTSIASLAPKPNGRRGLVKGARFQ